MNRQRDLDGGRGPDRAKARRRRAARPQLQRPRRITAAAELKDPAISEPLPSQSPCVTDPSLSSHKLAISEPLRHRP